MELQAVFCSFWDETIITTIVCILTDIGCFSFLLQLRITEMRDQDLSHLGRKLLSFWNWTFHSSLGEVHPLDQLLRVPKPYLKRPKRDVHLRGLRTWVCAILDDRHNSWVPAFVCSSFTSAGLCLHKNAVQMSKGKLNVHFWCAWAQTFSV